MPVPGSKPTMDRSQVRRANADVIEWREYEDTPYTGAPPLPPRQMAEGPDAPVGALDRWPDWTQRWYRTVSRMPHAKDWTPGDWEYVWQTAEAHARFMEGWKGHNGAELRMRQKPLGLTSDDRRDLRIRYVPKGTLAARRKAERGAATGTEGAAVARLADYRDL
jgi:hypothetical protein